MIVYILQEKGEWKSELCYLAYRGFLNRGYDVRPFTAEEMESGTLPLSRETIVHGGIPQIRRALTQIGVPFPRFDTYPYPLRQFMDRPPTEVLLEKIVNAVQEPGFKPCFIKPSDTSNGVKLFTGTVVSKYADLLKVMHCPENTRVWQMPVMSWISEYRVFVHKHEILSVRCYKGDPLVFPDVAVIRKMLTASKAMPQVAFSMDVGIAHFPERPEKIRTPTLLVEANDAHSLGPYGLPAPLYAHMIEDRWNQIVAVK